MTKYQDKEMVQDAKDAKRTLEEKAKEAYSNARDDLHRAAGKAEQWTKDTYKEAKESVSDKE